MPCQYRIAVIKMSTVSEYSNPHLSKNNSVKSWKKMCQVSKCIAAFICVKTVKCQKS